MAVYNSGVNFYSLDGKRRTGKILSADEAAFVIQRWYRNILQKRILLAKLEIVVHFSNSVKLIQRWWRHVLRQRIAEAELREALATVSRHAINVEDSKEHQLPKAPLYSSSLVNPSSENFAYYDSSRAPGAEPSHSLLSQDTASYSRYGRSSLAVSQRSGNYGAPNDAIQAGELPRETSSATVPSRDSQVFSGAYDYDNRVLPALAKRRLLEGENFSALGNSGEVYHVEYDFEVPSDSENAKPIPETRHSFLKRNANRAVHVQSCKPLDLSKVSSRVNTTGKVDYSAGSQYLCAMSSDKVEDSKKADYKRNVPHIDNDDKFVCECRYEVLSQQYMLAKSQFSGGKSVVSSGGSRPHNASAEAERKSAVSQQSLRILPKSKASSGKPHEPSAASSHITKETHSIQTAYSSGKQHLSNRHLPRETNASVSATGFSQDGYSSSQFSSDSASFSNRANLRELAENEEMPIPSSLRSYDANYWMKKKNGSKAREEKRLPASTYDYPPLEVEQKVKEEFSVEESTSEGKPSAVSSYSMQSGRTIASSASPDLTNPYTSVSDVDKKERKVLVVRKDGKSGESLDNNEFLPMKHVSSQAGEYDSFSSGLSEGNTSSLRKVMIKSTKLLSSVSSKMFKMSCKTKDDKHLEEETYLKESMTGQHQQGEADETPEEVFERNDEVAEEEGSGVSSWETEGFSGNGKSIAAVCVKKLPNDEAPSSFSLPQSKDSIPSFPVEDVDNSSTRRTGKTKNGSYTVATSGDEFSGSNSADQKTSNFHGVSFGFEDNLPVGYFPPPRAIGSRGRVPGFTSQRETSSLSPGPSEASYHVIRPGKKVSPSKSNALKASAVQAEDQSLEERPLPAYAPKQHIGEPAGVLLDATYPAEKEKNAVNFEKGSAYPVSSEDEGIPPSTPSGAPEGGLSELKNSCGTSEVNNRLDHPIESLPPISTARRAGSGSYASNLSSDNSGYSVSHTLTVVSEQSVTLENVPGIVKEETPESERVASSSLASSKDGKKESGSPLVSPTKLARPKAKKLMPKFVKSSSPGSNEASVFEDSTRVKTKNNESGLQQPQQVEAGLPKHSPQKSIDATLEKGVGDREALGQIPEKQEAGRKQKPQILAVSYSTDAPEHTESLQLTPKSTLENDANTAVLPVLAQEDSRATRKITHTTEANGTENEMLKTSHNEMIPNLFTENPIKQSSEKSPKETNAKTENSPSIQSKMSILKVKSFTASTYETKAHRASVSSHDKSAVSDEKKSSLPTISRSRTRSPSRPKAAFSESVPVTPSIEPSLRSQALLDVSHFPATSPDYPEDSSAAEADFVSRREHLLAKDIQGREDSIQPARKLSNMLSPNRRTKSSCVAPAPSLEFSSAEASAPRKLGGKVSKLPSSMKSSTHRSSYEENLEELNGKGRSNNTPSPTNSPFLSAQTEKMSSNRKFREGEHYNTFASQSTMMDNNEVSSVGDWEGSLAASSTLPASHERVQSIAVAGGTPSEQDTLSDISSRRKSRSLKGKSVSSVKKRDQNFETISKKSPASSYPNMVSYGVASSSMPSPSIPSGRLSSSRTPGFPRVSESAEPGMQEPSRVRAPAGTTSRFGKKVEETNKNGGKDFEDNILAGTKVVASKKYSPKQGSAESGEPSSVDSLKKLFIKIQKSIGKKKHSSLKTGSAASPSTSSATTDPFSASKTKAMDFVKAGIPIITEQSPFYKEIEEMMQDDEDGATFEAYQQREEVRYTHISAAAERW